MYKNETLINCLSVCLSVCLKTEQKDSRRKKISFNLGFNQLFIRFRQFPDYENSNLNRLYSFVRWVKTGLGLILNFIF